MPVPATLWKIGTHWARRFGCPVELLSDTSVAAVAHAALNNWEGAYLFQHGSALVVSVPPGLLEETRAAVDGHQWTEIFSLDFASDLFGPRIDRIIGPAWLGYADRSDFHPVDESGVRPVETEDMPALLALAASCGSDWEDSGIDIGRAPVFGRFIDDRLVSAGTVEKTSEEILNVGIVTHPERRSRGHGRAVVSALTRHGLQRGKIMQYRTLQANAASHRIARMIGYAPYGQTIAVRLTEPASGEHTRSTAEPHEVA